MPRKIETVATGGRNGGIDNVKEYRKACNMLTNHTFTNAQLWHMVLVWKEQGKSVQDREAFATATDRIVEKLRDSGMPVEFKAAYELCPKKGFHRHIYFVIEAKEHKPAGLLRFRPNGWLVKMLDEHGLGFHLARPKNPIHKTGKGFPKKYAYVPKTPGPMLDDCLDWISYIYKRRTKEGVEGSRYSSSRRKNAKEQP